MCYLVLVLKASSKLYDLNLINRHIKENFVHTEQRNFDGAPEYPVYNK